MRSIEIDTEVFSKIWSHRVAGEEDENAILRRLLGLTTEARDVDANFKGGRILWRDDVREALERLGGKAHLSEIYRAVRDQRRAEGRRVPRSTDAIVRRELEYNSSDSESYMKQQDWFYSVGGIGSGVWGLRYMSGPNSLMS